MKSKRLRPQDLALIGMFVALLSVCAWIVVPGTVPFTMQTFAVFLAAFLLGCKRGVLVMVVYILMGTVGVPVFSGFTGGLSVILGPTGGYLVGFVVSVLVVGKVTDAFGRKIWVQAVAAGAGLLVCYVVGTLWFMTVYAPVNGAVSAMTAIMMCVVPYVVPDVVKIALAIFMSRKLFRHVN